MAHAGGIVAEFFTLREETTADVLAMQVGDFYEFFGEDAELVHEELDLKLSQKSAGNESYPMAGVPVDDLTPYLTALVERGYRVAVADQQETDGDHHREITRVVSPGTLLETTDAHARYLATIVTGPETYGLALADVTTGQFFVTTLPQEQSTLLAELYRFSPVEVLPGPDLRTTDGLITRIRDELDTRITLHESAAFAAGKARHTVTEQFGEGALTSVGLDTDVAVPAIQAAGGALDYIADTGMGVLASFTRLQQLRDGDHVALDATTQRNLELTETMQGDRSGSLLATIDRTVTSAGRRQLEEWLVRPRRDGEELRRRLDSVGALTRAAMAREQLQDILAECYDLSRLASKAAHGSADPTHLRRIQETLAVLDPLVELLSETPQLTDTPLTTVFQHIDRATAQELQTHLDMALTADPPTAVTDGGIIARGYDEDLDEILDEYDQHMEWIETLADRIKQQHGLAHVTVDRNKTDGYYIQVGKSEADAVPEHFQQIKTLKNSKRFVTQDLEAHERELLRLEEQRTARERELFRELRSTVAKHASLLQAIGRTIATLDVFAGLATHAAERGWTRPDLTDPGAPIDIERGRHPVVETTTEFVPNDTRLDDDRQFLIVTGPNMSGKSTYMRQTALIVLLAQMGSFVPADHAEIGLVDGIYTRVGALDELAQGRSTFMVEMQELSNILHSATDQSLVILDEVGRGTATYDGISIAWSTTEYLHNQIGAKTLFATHYHELTALAEHLDRVHNVHVAAEETNGDVTFLRTIREGPTDRSYGIHVADLAGVPGPVVTRARTVLDRLRQDEAIEARGDTTDEPSDSGTTQVVFDLQDGQFQSATQPAQSAASPLTEQYGDAAENVLAAIRDLDVEATSPLELMTTVQSWQEQLDQ